VLNFLRRIFYYLMYMLLHLIYYCGFKEVNNLFNNSHIHTKFILYLHSHSLNKIDFLFLIFIFSISENTIRIILCIFYACIFYELTLCIFYAIQFYYHGSRNDIYQFLFAENEAYRQFNVFHLVTQIDTIVVLLLTWHQEGQNDIYVDYVDICVIKWKVIHS